MHDGFIKISVGTPKIKLADCEYNAAQIIKLMREACDKKAHVLALPELCITGYTCGDLFLQRRLLDGAALALQTLIKESRGLNLLTIAGVPLTNNGKLYNCAAVIFNGKMLGAVPKKNLPNYNEFYEQRHFTAADDTLSVIRIFGDEIPFGTNLIFFCDEMEAFSVAVEICEDLWVPSPPSVSHALAGASVIVNLSASDEIIGKEEYRRSLVSAQSASLICGYVYAGAGEGESTTDMVFAGHKMIAEYGTMLAEHLPFEREETLLTSEIDVDFIENERRRLTTFPLAKVEGYQRIAFHMKNNETALTRVFAAAPFVPADMKDREHRCEMILAMQAYALKNRIEYSGCKNAVIGISGGLDSCLALLVIVKTMDLLKLPRTGIIAVTMPCFGTTKRTLSNAERLCDSLGVTLKSIDITESVLLHFKDIGHDINLHNTVYENVQARERTQVLMDIANQANGLVIGTGDLSENALGWSTYSGDHMAMYNVNASVPKTLVRHIVKYAADYAKNEKEKQVLIDILETPVSPELLPAENGEISQKTEEIVGPYELHDFFLYYMLRRSFTPKKVLRLAQEAFKDTYETATIIKWLRVFYKRFFALQFKRSCMPDGPKIGSVTLSPRADLRMPSDASSALWLKELDEL